MLITEGGSPVQRVSVAVAIGPVRVRSALQQETHLARVRVQVRVGVRDAVRVSCSRRRTAAGSPPSTAAASADLVRIRVRVRVGVESTLARASASWLPGGCSQRQTMPQASASLGRLANESLGRSWLDFDIGADLPRHPASGHGASMSQPASSSIPG